MADGRNASSDAGGKSMHNLRIEYVQRLPRAGEDLPPDVVELWMGVSGRTVVVNIVRRGFILAAPVMRIIRGRIKGLALATRDISRPLPERIEFWRATASRNPRCVARRATSQCNFTQ